ncbi:MAG: restriction endonuclease subunit S [Candidatus Paceibacterota bacterium]
MHTKVSQIGQVINGYTFREAIETDKKGDVFVLQAKDIIQGQDIVNSKDLTPISFKGTRTASFLQKDDILIVSRGANTGSFRTTIFSGNDDNVIASSSVLILRIKKEKVLPEYIATYLNSPEGQNKILQVVSGSYIQSISRIKFEELEIPIPPLKIQQSLNGLNRNIKQQELIYKRGKELKQEIVNTIITNL